MRKKAISLISLLALPIAYAESHNGTLQSSFDRVFDMINKCENGTNINDLLEGPTCHGGFERLN